MPHRRVVVDGSNIATEGRTVPSLNQLNEAVLAFLNEFPESEITVVVDASFGHRIDPSELAEFEAAESAGELVSPPAGAIGRGDAFLLRIAGKVGAMVLSNDSFQEFHGDHDWLFTEGRLIGGKPVPGVGWIFTPRTPVRGVKSRKAVKEAKGKVKAVALSSGEALAPMPVPRKPPPTGKAAKAVDDKPVKKAKAPKEITEVKAVKETKAVKRAIELAAEESVEPAREGGHRRRRKRRAFRPAEPVNEPLPFITFIANHKLGTEVTGEVDTFTSHGAFVQADGARCYIPIVALGDPPPRAARDVLQKGEVRTFVVQALDPQRRGVELALPEYARVAGTPTAETIEAEIAGPAITLASDLAEAGEPPAGRPTRASKAAKAAKVPAVAAGREASKRAAAAPKKVVAVAKTAPASRSVKKAGRPAKAGASIARPEVDTGPRPEKKAKKAATGKKAAAVKTAPPIKKAAAAKKAAPIKKAAGKKAAAPKKAAPMKKAAAAKKAAVAKKAEPAENVAPAKRAAKKAGGQAGETVAGAVVEKPARKGAGRVGGKKAPPG